MSVFKRLGNVAKGKMKELGRTLEDALPSDYSGDDDGGDPGDHGEPFPSRSDPSGDQKRQMLQRLHDEGLLSDEELETKLAALEEASAPRPRKRHL